MNNENIPLEHPKDYDIDIGKIDLDDLNISNRKFSFLYRLRSLFNKIFKH